MNWSENAWQAVNGIYNSILKMPFIEELSDGSLPMKTFQFYMLQDSYYLEHFGRALALIGAKAHDGEDALAYLQFAENAIVVEQALHESYFKDFGVSDKGIIQPACHHYTHFLRSTAALEPVEVAMAATLPCFWIYKNVGEYIYTHHLAAENPFQNWIETYAGEEFTVSVERAIDLCNKAALQTTPQIRRRMTEAFITASRLEYQFWDAAYNLKRWEL